MSSNTTTSPKVAPLSFMTPLNSCLAYFDPQTRPAPSNPPLILVLGWMDAQDVHLAKYIQQHRVLFPTSRILLARCTLYHFTNLSFRLEQLRPAISVLQESTMNLGSQVKVGAKRKEGEEGGGSGGKERDEEPRMLVHIFSNGGIASALTLWDLWISESLGGNSLGVPHHVVLMDSCPGYFAWHRAHFAVASYLPPWASPLVHLLIAYSWVTHIPFGYQLPQDVNANMMLAPGRLAREARRTYLYGTGDEAVGSDDVEKHASRAKEMGVNGLEVRTERFEHGKHVAHVRVDAERYWRVVKETWEGWTR